MHWGNQQNRAPIYMEGPETIHLEQWMEMTVHNGVMAAVPTLILQNVCHCYLIDIIFEARAPEVGGQGGSRPPSAL